MLCSSYRVNSVVYVSSLMLLLWAVNGFVFVACCFLVCLTRLVCCLFYVSWVLGLLLSCVVVFGVLGVFGWILVGLLWLFRVL